MKLTNTPPIRLVPRPAPRVEIDAERLLRNWPPDEWTLGEARTFVEMGRDVGVDCPCCGHPCRVYPRVLNATTVRSLCWLVRAIQGETVQVGDGGYAQLPLVDGFVDVPTYGPTWVVRSNQHSALRWWRLAEHAPNDDKRKRDSGMWRPTELGVAFAEGRVVVPRRVFHYRGEAVGYGEEMTSIVAALGENFDYSVVMARPAPGTPITYAPFRWESYGAAKVTLAAESAALAEIPVVAEPLRRSRPFALTPKEVNGT